MDCPKMGKYMIILTSLDIYTDGLGKNGDFYMNTSEDIG